MRIDEILSTADATTLERMGFTAVEEKQVGPYSLFLVYMDERAERFFGGRYQLGLNKDGSSFTDWGTQLRKHEAPGQATADYMKEFDATIERWIKEHGSLLVGSQNPKKTQFYAKLLKRRGFTVVEPAFGVLRVS